METRVRRRDGPHLRNSIAVRTGTRESRRAIMLSALRDRRDCELSQSVSCQALDALLPPDMV